MAKQSFPPVLMTRPAEQGARFGAALAARFAGIRVIDSPLMAPHFPTPVFPLRDYAALVFTSETAVEAYQRLSAEMRDTLPQRAFCVGARTAVAAEGAGLAARSADGDVKALAAMIIGADPTGPLLYFRGLDIAGDLAETLNSAGIETFSAIVYEQRSLSLGDSAQEVLARRGSVIVPLFSPRSARLFVEQVRQSPITARLCFAAISSATAVVLAECPHDALETAHSPDADAMIDAIARLVALEGQAAND